MTSALPPVAPLTSEDILDTLYRLVVQEFIVTDDVEGWITSRRRLHEEGPYFSPDQRRGIVDGGQFLGGYVIYERQMRMGSVTVTTGCIGSVVTHPNHRGRGVGRAIMQDAIEYARSRHHTFILLNGVPGFYHRFGYMDVFDEALHVIDCQAIPAQPAAGLRVRPATLADTSDLFALYRRHDGSHPGSFAWTQDGYQHRLAYRMDRFGPPTVVEDQRGRLQGYLYSEPGSSKATEVAADTWPAALALLHHHASVAASSEGDGRFLTWRLPPDSATLYLLGQHLPAMGSDKYFHDAIRTTIRQSANAGWQARPIDLPTAIQSLTPWWQHRRQQSSHPNRGPITLDIEGQNFTLPSLSPHPTTSPATAHIQLTAQAFSQLLFGYRPAWWLADQDGVSIPPDLIPLAQAVFPVEGFWIPGTDTF